MGTSTHQLSESSRKVIVKRMDDTPIASFDLPFSSASADDQQHGNEWRGYHDPIMCWASFRRDDVHNTTGISSNCSGGEDSGRKMLCILGNPTTLLIFDVLGDAALKATNNTTADCNVNNTTTTGGPAGHTIPLPFRARALYNVNSGNEGLLILRTPSNEECDNHNLRFGINNTNLMSPEGLSIPRTPQRLSTVGGFDGVAASNEQHNNNHKPTTNDEDFELEDPPEPVRLNFHPGQNEQHPLQGISTEEFEVPCLFSLCHPLDEIRPVTVNAKSTGGGVAGVAASSTNGAEHLFSNVMETLVFVGSPRLFSGTINAPNNKTGIQSAAPICVTYNEALKRHAVWSFSKAASPVPELPLWKTTGRGVWRQEIQEGGNDVMEQDAKEDDATEPLGKSLFHDGDPFLDSTTACDEGVPLSLSDIHPDFNMSLLFVEEGDAHNATTSAMVVDESNDCRYQRHVFLATDELGRGDLVLCVFMPNNGKSDQSNDEPAILRCYSLGIPDPFHDNHNSLSIASVSHSVDLPCSSAEPIKSIPIPLRPFSTKNGRSTSRFHSVDVNTMACDVLVLHKNGSVGMEGEKGTTLSLYRAGATRVVDFVLPKDICDGHQVLKLDNSVGNRADVVLREGDKQEDRILTVRASFSLIMHTSPVTEMALRAIESSLVQNRSDHASVLPLLIRADCAYLFQHLWSDDGGRDMKKLISTVENGCWYALTVVLLKLLLGVRSNTEHQTIETKVTSDSSAWEELLQSDFHFAFSQGEGKMLFGDSDFGGVVAESKHDDLSRYNTILSSLQFAMEVEGDVSDYKQHIFDSLHLLHEDARLASQARASWTGHLGSLLLHVSEEMTPFMLDFEDHYHRLLGNSRCLSNASFATSPNGKNKQRLSNFTLCPCIMTCLDCILQMDTPCSSYDDVEFGMIGYGKVSESGLNGVCSKSWTVLRLFGLLFDRSGRFSRHNASSREDEKMTDHSDDGSEQHRRDRIAIMAMLDEGIYHPIQLYDELPFGVSYPILEAIHRCRLDPPQIDYSPDCWPPSAYDLVGRNDLSELSLSRPSMMTAPKQPKQRSVRGDAKSGGPSSPDDVDKDGLVALEDYSSMIFPEDNRIREAARLVRSSRPLFLRVPRPVELSDHDYERSKQEKLNLLCRRSIAMPLGRGMMTLGTHHISSAEQLFIPDIVLAGRVPPSNGSLALGEYCMTLHCIVSRCIRSHCDVFLSTPQT